jgi:hypothetical protein
MMKTLMTATLVGLALAVTPALAQTQTKAQPPAKTAAVDTAAVDAKFKAADKNGNGSLEGAELDAYKATLAQIDANKDGKISRDEFAAASKAGLIK